MAPLDEKSARQWALRALGRRMHTAGEISQGLARRGYPDDVVRLTVRDLTDRGYLDDLDFARAWVASRTAHQLHGRLRLLRDLKGKGIGEELARSVLAETLTEEDEVATALKAARKKQRVLKGNGRRNREAIYRHLRTRGFTSRIVSLAMDGLSLEEDST